MSSLAVETADHGGPAHKEIGHSRDFSTSGPLSIAQVRVRRGGDPRSGARFRVGDVTAEPAVVGVDEVAFVALALGGVDAATSLDLAVLDRGPFLVGLPAHAIGPGKLDAVLPPVDRGDVFLGQCA